MTVKELIEKLKELPQDARVFHLWDGEPRTAINVVYETKNGAVMTADYGQVCYSSSARPKEAPNSEEDRYWKTEKDPNGDLAVVVGRSEQFLMPHDFTERDNFSGQCSICGKGKLFH